MANQSGYQNGYQNYKWLQALPGESALMGPFPDWTALKYPLALMGDIDCTCGD